MVDMDKIVSLSKRRGFIFQSSEIYGGLGSAWDYGPLGVELKNNVKRLWWRDNVHLRDDMVGLDAAITMHPRVWEASGHLASFSDPFTGCLDCGRHYRADHVEEARKNSKWWQKLMEVRAKGTWSAVINWVKGDGKKLAPNLASVKQAEEFAERDFSSGPRTTSTLRERIHERNWWIRFHLPELRWKTFRAETCRPDARNLSRSGARNGDQGLSQARDGPGDLRQFRQRPSGFAEEIAVRNRADR